MQDKACEDRFVAEQIRSELGEIVAVMAVADGAGSALQSGLGAERAVDGFIDCVFAALRHTRVAQLPDNAPHTWLKTMRDKLLEEAAQANIPPEEYSSTFLGVVAGEEATIFVQIGDGMILMRSDDAPGWQLACTPQAGEYINETWFLTSPDALERVEIRRLDVNVSDIALTTDGLQNVCFDRMTNQLFPEFFEHLMATVLATPPEQDAQLHAALTRFLESDRFDAYTSDDKTLVLAARLRD